MFDREIQYINKNGIDSTAEMLRAKFPNIEKQLKEYTPRTEKIKIGICEYERLLPEDSFNTVSFVLKYYPNVISEPDFNKYTWIEYLYYINGLSLNGYKDWNTLSELLETALDKEGKEYVFPDSKFEEESLSYTIGTEPLSRTPTGNPFYNGLKYDNPLEKSRYNDVSPKDEQIIRKLHFIPDDLFWQNGDTDIFDDLIIDDISWQNGNTDLIDDFIFKRDSLYEALLYDKGDWDYNKIITGHFVELIQSIFNMKYPLIDSTINLADINTHSNNSYSAWQVMLNLARCIFDQSTAFILYNWYIMDKDNEERLNLFVRVTWVIQKYICSQDVRKKIDDFALNHTEVYKSFGEDSMNSILEEYGYTAVQNQSASEIIRDIKKITESAFADSKRQIEKLIKLLKEEMKKYSDEDLETVFVCGRDSVFKLEPDSGILQFPFLPVSIFEYKLGSDEQRRSIPGSVKYTFLNDFKGYDSTVDLHDIFCDDAYDEEISDWVIQVYRNLLKGGGAEKFVVNQSYLDWIAGEKIPQTNVYDNNVYSICDEYGDFGEIALTNMCDYFPPDTNFRPYQEILNKVAIYQSAHNTLYKIFHIKGILSLALENCYWIDSFLNNQEGDEYNILIDSLITNVRSYVYNVPNAKKTRKNYEVTVLLHKQVRELKIIREFASVLRNDLLQSNDKNSLSCTLNNWISLKNVSIPLCTNGYENDVIAILYDEVLTGLNEALSKMPEKESQLKILEKDNGKLFDKLGNDFDKLYNGVPNQNNLKTGMIDQLKEFLSDASTLYAMYVSDNKGAIYQLSDYSPVALNYYRALEFLVNQMFYIPYKIQVLDAGITGNPKDFFGNSKGQIQRKNTVKPSLEIRTFAIFMGGIDTSNKTLLSLNDYPIQLYNFLIQHDVDINKLRSFCLDLYEVGNLRNACAHPSIQDVSYAVKAKTVVYKHEKADDVKISNIPDASMIYEMIIKLSKIVLPNSLVPTTP